MRVSSRSLQTEEQPQALAAMTSLTPSGRQSPFRRQPSTNSPSPLRATTPSTSPTKPSLLSPARQSTAPPRDRDHASLLPSQQAFLERASSPAPGSPTRGALPTPASRDSRAESPVRRLQSQFVSSPDMQSPSDRSILPPSPSTQILVGSNNSIPRTESPMRQPVFAQNKENIRPTPQLKSIGNYNSIPAPLLRSLRESFEVLDPNATGTLNSTALPPVLDQIGLPVDNKTLSSYFPTGRPQQMNLASYLDMLCGPISQLSSQDELVAAFGAFDIDDSGQIDVHELKQALLRTKVEPRETNPGAELSEADIDAVLQDFTGRRAFGKSTSKTTPSARGDVFKWRDFVNSVNGGAETAQPVAV